MATLNIKNFPDSLERAEPASLMELEGLGKELWRGIEAAEPVDEERRSWD